MVFGVVLTGMATAGGASLARAIKGAMKAPDGRNATAFMLVWIGTWAVLISASLKQPIDDAGKLAQERLSKPKLFGKAPLFLRD